jgi:hypothetical protein
MRQGRQLERFTTMWTKGLSHVATSPCWLAHTPNF